MKIAPTIDDHSLAWTAESATADHIVSLSNKALDEIFQFVEEASLEYDQFNCAEVGFRKKSLEMRITHQELRTIEHNHLSTKPGYVLVEGPDPDTLSLLQLKLALAAISNQLGELLPQDATGQMVKEVKDRGTNYEDSKRSRYSDTRLGGNYHTDGAEIPERIRYFPFYCVRQAKSGGATQVVNAYAIHNRLLRDNPRCLKILYQPFRWDRRGDLGPIGEASFQKPIFLLENGKLSCDYLRQYIEDGYRVENEAVPDDVIQALDAMDEHLYDPQLIVSLPMTPGQIYISNNSFTLHGRTEYEDHPNAPRLFLRSWVKE